MKKSIFYIAAAIAMFGIQPAFATGPAGFARDALSESKVAFITEKQPTLAPFAQVRFCLQNPSECRPSNGEAMIVLTGARNQQLSAVNRDVNRSIRPMNDPVGEDNWAVNVTAGDCEKYALTKRNHLIAAGWSPRALRIAVATTRSGEGHAVLVVKTDKGDLVLDNRTGRIKNWRATDLTWLKIQSGENPNLWYTL